MRVTINGKNLEVTDALRSYTERKVSHLDHYFTNLRDAHVIISTQRNWQIVEVQLDGDGVFLRSEERTGDAYASVDGVVDKLERQIKRFKGKLIQRHRHPAEDSGVRAGSETVDLGDTSEDDEALPVVVRTKRIATKPMVAEEAAMQMELLNHDFFVFQNADSGAVNVVYRRRDGNYGLIEPEVE